MVWNTIRSTKNKYKVLLSQVCKFSLQKKEKERKTLRLLKRILKIGLRNYLSSQLRIKSFYLSQRLEFF